jgi:hypothetical protein
MNPDNKEQGMKLSVNQLLGIAFLTEGGITLLTYVVVRNLSKNK